MAPEFLVHNNITELRLDDVCASLNMQVYTVDGYDHTSHFPYPFGRVKYCLA